MSIDQKTEATISMLRKRLAERGTRVEGKSVHKVQPYRMGDQLVYFRVEAVIDWTGNTQISRGRASLFSDAALDAACVAESIEMLIETISADGTVISARPVEAARVPSVGSADKLGISVPLSVRVTASFTFNGLESFGESVQVDWT